MLSFNNMYRQFDEFSIGVDRGGTLTRVIAVSVNGKHLRETRFSTAAEISSFTETLSGIIKEWKAAKAPLAIASRGVMSVPEVRKSIISGMKNKASLKAVISDAEAAHMSAFGGSNGILLISGTGSVVLSGAPGAYSMTGGKNPVSGDPGSGRWFGRRWLVRHGRLKENEYMDHAESAAYARKLFEVAENCIKKGTAASDIEKFCFDTMQEGAEYLAGLLLHVSEGLHGLIKVAVAGGIMQNIMYREMIIKAWNQIKTEDCLSFFSPSESAEEAAARLAYRLRDMPDLEA
ncbi:MAG: hypothetical protein J6Z08_06205 [Elusimicrobiales bacterium]|nr:hypothetical protein [Elusimicrobiales bacterium]